jgi:hypothetical protein
MRQCPGHPGKNVPIGELVIVETGRPFSASAVNSWWLVACQALPPTSLPRKRESTASARCTPVRGSVAVHRTGMKCLGWVVQPSLAMTCLMTVKSSMA